MWICHITIVICHTSSSECVTKQMLPSSSIYNIHTVHNVRSYQFLSCFELNSYHFYLQKLLIIWQKITMKIKFWIDYILGLNTMYSNYWCKNLSYLVKWRYLWQTIFKYLHTGLKTQNLEKLSLDLNLINNVCQNIILICKRSCMLRIHEKFTEFTENRTEIDKNFQWAVCGRA